MKVRAPGRLPTELRVAVFICLLLSAMVGVLSGSQVMELNHASEIRSSAVPSMGWFGQESMRSVLNAQLSALESMKGTRTAILAGLSIACALAFVSATRILWPGGLPREGVRRLLWASLLAAAIFRTVDGAQWAAVWRNVGVVRAFSSAISAVPYFGAGKVAEELQGRILLGGVILHTVLVAGGFLLLSQYFRSRRIREIVQLEDERSQRP